MECRRISTAVISAGYGTGDSLRKSQYITVIKCRLQGKENRVGKLLRCFRNRNAYYCTVLENGNIQWFGVSGSSSFISEYKLEVEETYTNIFAFLGDGKSRKRKNKEGDSHKDSENVPLPGSQSFSPSFSFCPSSSCIVFAADGVFIECGDKVVFYNAEGSRVYDIDLETGKLRSIFITLCAGYLLFHYENGMALLHNIRDRKSVYRKKLPTGHIEVHGELLEYSLFVLHRGKSVLICRLKSGEILLEVSFPAEICSATLDMLQKRVVVGTAEGSIYQTRLDGEESEFSQIKTGNSPICAVHFSTCGTLLYGMSKQFLFVIGVRDGQVLRTLPAEGEEFFFTKVTSTNLHLQ